MADRAGKELFRLDGTPSRAGKMLDAPGEQIVTYDTDGTVRIYCCPNALDSPQALARYAHPYYDAARRIWASGYNATNLGGL